jgi:aspartyl-tRNA(Asn)/glutamyl-tRNA(Gln) amidotransferase subunit A
MTELHYTPATELARLIRERRLSPVELMSATIARAEALSPRLNAICTPTFEQVMAAAHEAEAAVMRGDTLGPLHGVPTTIKDLVLTKGVRSMAGSRIFADRIPDVDSPVVERLRAAGAISLGKTTCPELGWKGCGDSPLTGISHNPWKHGTNAGGSSTGAAICAAAGIGPVHQGSDGAGSIRIPGSLCGVYGIKPSFGRVPNFPPPNNDNMSCVGPLTRTVADAALMLQVMAGPDDRDQGTLPGPVPDFSADLDAGVKGLRIAFSPDLGFLRVDPEVAALVRAAVAAFDELGAVVEEVDPGFGDTMPMIHNLYCGNLAGSTAAWLDTWRERMDPGLVAMADLGRAMSAEDYVAARGRRLELYQQARAFFAGWDLLVTPTLSVAAFGAGRILPEHWGEHPWDWLRWAGFAYPFNLTWLPAATCPCGFTAAGLPVGLQIVAWRWQETRVLQASRAFEQARPWADRRPPLN